MKRKLICYVLTNLSKDTDLPESGLRSDTVAWIHVEIILPSLPNQHYCNDRINYSFLQNIITKQIESQCTHQNLNVIVHSWVII